MVIVPKRLWRVVIDKPIAIGSAAVPLRDRIEGAVFRRCSAPGSTGYFGILRGDRDFVHLVACESARRAMPVTLDRPMFVVLVLEPLGGSLQVLDARVRFQTKADFPWACG